MSQLNHPLDVIVRFHDPDRLFELRRAIFALVCQSYRPLTILVVTQRFSQSELERLSRELAPTLSLDSSVASKIANYTTFEPPDARSALLNLGIRTATGNYLAFLDHDDTIYPEAYSHLIAELASSRCAIAFGSIVMKDVDVFEDALLVNRKRATFLGKSLLDLFQNNFCPIHSFVIDRSRVLLEHLWFEEALTKLEDYDLLLRLCATYESSFRLIRQVVGDYYIKDDGSNTLSGGVCDNDWWMKDWERTTKLIEARKSMTVITSSVQRLLEISPPEPELTVSQLLDRHGIISSTWSSD